MNNNSVSQKVEEYNLTSWQKQRPRLVLSKWIERPKHSPLRESEAALLAAICEAERLRKPLKEKQLAEFLHIRPNSLTTVIGKLVRRRLCKVTPISKDKYPAITERGRQELSKYASQLFLAPAKLLEELARETPEVYEQSMQRLERILDKDFKDGIDRVLEGDKKALRHRIY